MVSYSFRWLKLKNNHSKIPTKVTYQEYFEEIIDEDKFIKKKNY